MDINVRGEMIYFISLICSVGSRLTFKNNVKDRSMIGDWRSSDECSFCDYQLITKMLHVHYINVYIHLF